MVSISPRPVARVLGVGIFRAVSGATNHCSSAAKLLSVTKGGTQVADTGKGSAGTRASLIREIRTPLALYALIVVVAEVLLGYVATKAKGLDLTLLIVGMLGILALVVLRATILASHKPISLPDRFHDQGIVHVSADRQHSRGKETYWEQAKASVNIFAPTLWRSLMGLTDTGTSEEVESLRRVALRLKGKMRILLLHPNSKSFEAHQELLPTTGDIGDITADTYASKLTRLEKILLPLGAEIRYYKTYPTVSFVIVDEWRVKVDYVLPHRQVKQRPLIEFEKSTGEAVLIFDVFLRVFERVWDDSEGCSLSRLP